MWILQVIEMLLEFCMLIKNERIHIKQRKKQRQPSYSEVYNRISKEGRESPETVVINGFIEGEIMPGEDNILDRKTVE